MQIPIVSGIYSDPTSDWRTSYPLNLIPVPKMQGISEGYLRIADGLTQTGTGPGVARGAIVWDGVLYRVMGTKLVSIDSNSAVTVLGDVGGSGAVSMTYSFDRLAVASSGKLFYWDKATLTEVTDPDLGTVLNVVWVDGYFMTTDGEFLVVTELLDPTAVDPLKYGSSEVDPDPILAVVKLRNEVFAVNRYSIEAFSNVGGLGFPFSVIRGAQVHKGAVGTHACIAYGDGIAFLGGGRNESVGVHVGANGGSQKISTREIDTVLSTYTEAQLSSAVLEVVEDRGHMTLMVHLRDKTLCFDAGASAATGAQTWYTLASGVAGDQEYRGRYFAWAYNKWNVADPTSAAIGHRDGSSGLQWGDVSRWEFGTPVVYNASAGVIVHSIELVGIPGGATSGTTSKISLEYSSDGLTWSMPAYIDAGATGARDSRLRWLRQGQFRQRRMLRFRGDTNGQGSYAAVEASLEALAW